MDGDLKRNTKGKEPAFVIARTGALVSTNGWWVVRTRAAAGRVEAVEWQKSLREGASVLTWTRVTAD